MEEHNISKYVDFYVVKKTSKKTNNDYYALVLRLFEKDYFISFINESRYNDILTKLSK